MRAVTLKVPYVGPSLNSIYAGVHWKKRKDQADEAHLCVKLSLKGVEPFTKPVHLNFQPLHKGRGYDVSNYAYTAKLIEDGLVLCGVIPDDTCKWVKRITIDEPIKVKGESLTVVTIVEVDDE